MSPSITVSPPEIARTLLGLTLGFVLALGLTPVCRLLACRFGLVAAPKEDRWHTKPTASLGGPAIVAGTILAFLAVSGFHVPKLMAAWLAGALLISVVGVLDDILHLRPASKLIGQIIAALIPLSLGLTVSFFHPIVSFGIALFWITGIANAFNLIDNMDGLASGIAAIASLALAIHLIALGNWPLAGAAASLAGASLGFLVFNFKPASIFMGDGGSLFLGFSLGTLTLMDLSSRPLVSASVITVPLLVLIIPIFDTTLVTVLRVANRRPITEGGRDHSSHRLVLLGLSERSAVLTLFSLSAAAGAFSLVVPRFSTSLVVVAALVWIFIVYRFGAFLGSVPVYRSDGSKRSILFSEHEPVESVDILQQAGKAMMLEGVAPAGVAHSPGEIRFLGEPRLGGRERFGIAARGEQAARLLGPREAARQDVPRPLRRQQIADAADVRRDGRQSGGHPLDQGERSPLVAARQDDGIQIGVHGRKIQPDPGEADLLADSHLHGRSGELLEARPSSDDHESGARDAPRNDRGGAQEQFMVLDRGDPPHDTEHEVFGGQTDFPPETPSLGQLFEIREIDRERNDEDLPSGNDRVAPGDLLTLTRRQDHGRVGRPSPEHPLDGGEDALLRGREVSRKNVAVEGVHRADESPLRLAAGTTDGARGTAAE